MKYALILASGTGSRMGNTELPKQFLNIGNKPVIIHTIEQFLLSTCIDKVIVVIKDEWENYFKDLINKYEIEVEIAIGGNDRNESIENGCKYISDNYGIKDDDIILTHDAVRPFITRRIIEENINKIGEYDAIDTIIPAVDTIVEIKGDIINNIPVRSNMYQGQTPQTFKLKELYKLLNELTLEQRNILTDACKIYSLNKKRVGYVLGEVYNFKITTPYDLLVANNIVKGDIEI